MKSGIFFMSGLLALTCCANTTHREISRPSSNRSISQEPLEISRRKESNIKDTRGVVVLNKFVKGDFVRFYNADGSLWYEFSYFYDDSDGKYDYDNDDFRPFAFHVDYFLLVLKCTDNNAKVLEVVVNEETGLRKYVKANDPVLKLEPWDKFVIGVFAVGFEQKANPLREAPNGQLKKVAVPKDAIFRPVETQGEWLKVRWDSAGEETTKIKRNGDGWIRWRNNEALLIDFHLLD